MPDEGASTRSPTVVKVDLGARSYDILIQRGLLQKVGDEILKRLPNVRAAIVTDETVARLHLPALQASLRAKGIDQTTITVPAGEESKGFAQLTRVVDGILASRVERNDIVIALGGGVVGDLAGFASAIVRRGTRFVQVPTTLLAQVDSSVGGKTGINSPRGKNLIGAFHQPSLVIADSAVLDSLPPRTFNAGYAEVAKIGLINDAGFFKWLEGNWRAMAAGWPERDQAVAIACRAKAATVAADEREEGVRALLNLGHTFGHALEAAAGFSDRLMHGEAVAIGMVLAHEFSARLGLAPAEDAARVVAHLKDVGLPTRISDIPGEPMVASRLMELIHQDKKVTRGKLTFILTHGIGKAFIANDIPATAVTDFLEAKLRG
jgi:3-dehydroquinate synthase